MQSTLRQCPFTKDDIANATCLGARKIKQQEARQEGIVCGSKEDGRTPSDVQLGQVTGAVGLLLVQKGLRDSEGNPLKLAPSKGTGVIIRWPLRNGRNYEIILTCGHNVIQLCEYSDTLVPIISGKFFKALEGKDECRACLELIGSPIVHERYTPKEMTAGFDIAVIDFDKRNYRDQAIHVECEVVDVMRLAKSDFRVIGYPGEKWGFQFEMTGPMEEMVRKRDGGVILKYKIDTTGGQSGSPVIAIKDGKLCIVGVHNGEFFPHPFNYATCITEDIILWLDNAVHTLAALHSSLSPEAPVAVDTGAANPPTHGARRKDGKGGMVKGRDEVRALVKDIERRLNLTDDIADTMDDSRSDGATAPRPAGKITWQPTSKTERGGMVFVVWGCMKSKLGLEKKTYGLSVYDISEPLHLTHRSTKRSDIKYEVKQLKVTSGSIIRIFSHRGYTTHGGKLYMADVCSDSLVEITSKGGRDLTRLSSAMVGRPGMFGLDDRIYIVGGDRDGQCSDTMESTSINGRGRWTLENARLPTGISGPACVVVRDVVYLSGGYSSSTPELSCLLSWRRGAQSWTTHTRMKQARWGHGMVEVNDNLYALGGCNLHGTPLSSMEMYIPEQDGWNQMPDMLSARYLMSVSTHREWILVMGGMTQYLDWDLSGDVEMFCTTSDQWSTCRIPLDTSFGSIAAAAVIEDTC